jgi:hypothetical protein
MKIVFDIAALKEFRDERRYYNARAPGLGDRLIALVDGTLTEIARAPHIEADHVVVLVALEHGRRKPGSWAKRLR